MELKMRETYPLPRIVKEVTSKCPDATHFVSVTNNHDISWGIFSSDADAAADLINKPFACILFKLDYLGTPHEIYRRA